MTAASLPTTAAQRLERILLLIPAAAQEGGIALGELAIRLDVSADALLTDIFELSDRAYYHPADSGTDLQIEYDGERVWIWTKGEFTRPVKLSPAEAVCVGLALRGEDAAGASEGLGRLESQMAAMKPQELLDHLETADLQHGGTGIRECVGRALQERTKVRIQYLKPGDQEPLDRRVRPYALAHAEGQWYLLAWCEVSEEVRIFRMDRILEASPTGTTFQVPEEFDPEAYIQGGRVYRGGEETAVQVRYAPQIARWIAERDTGTWDPEGGFTVTHRVVDPHWIVRHVLQYGAEAEVLGPEEVRGWVGGVKWR